MTILLHGGKVRAMKTRFQPQICSKCSTVYDGLASRCSHCDEPSSDEGTKKFDHFLHLPLVRQVGLFFLGWAGFQLIAVILSLIFQTAWAAANPGFTPEMAEEYVHSASYSAPVHFIAYTLLFGFLTLLLWKDNLLVLKSFKNKKGWLIGLSGFAALFVFQLVYGNVVSLILEAFGLELQSNANENALNVLTKAYPVLSVLIFGFVAPYCEELTYRAGLFSFFGRIGKWASYVLSALVFGLIHFDWTCFGDTNALLIELYNLPVYIMAGVILGYVYDKGGFNASLTTHVLNNLLSTIATIFAE